MVFGWGKKKSAQKSEPNLPSKKEVGLYDVPYVVSDLSKLRTKQLISEVSRFREKTNPLIKELSDIIRQLEKDDLKVDDIDKHLRVIVVRGKKQVIEIIKRETVPLDKVSSFDDVIKLNNNLGSMLKKIGDVLGRQTRVIHIFAKKYAEKLKQILEEMNENNTEIKSLIKNFETSNSYSKSILESLEKLKKIEQNLQSKKDKILKLEQSLDEVIKKIESQKNSLADLKNSSAYRSFQETKKILSNMDSQKNKIKNEIDSYFTKISRPLSRYEYASSLDKEQKTLLSQLIDNAFNVMVPANKDSIIVILENVRKGISTGTISVKDTEKSMAHLTETVEALDNLTSKVESFLNQKKELESRISSTRPSKLETLEKSLNHMQEERREIDSKIKQLTQEVSDDEQLIPELIRRIESDLRLFSNVQYSVTI